MSDFNDRRSSVEKKYERTADIFPKFQGKGYPVPSSEDYTEQDVPTDRLVATQSVVLAGVESEKTDPISVTHRRGWYFVGEGHHRAASAIRRGDPHIAARIYPSGGRDR